MGNSFGILSRIWRGSVTNGCVVWTRCSFGAQRTRTKIQSEILFGQVRHSEVNHLTVTRIVGSHVECQKRVQTYRADLTLTLNNIKRQQCQLRRTMVHYSRKLRHNKKEREERKQKAKMEAEMKNLKLPPIVEEAEQNADDEQSENESESDTNGEENEENVDVADVKYDEQTTETVLPIITVEGESNEEIPSAEDTGDNDGKDTEQPVEPEEANPMDILTKNLQEGCNDPPKLPDVSTDPNDFNIEMYSKKKRKRPTRNVNYSDLIKLRHSTNKKKLFSLVDKLSKVHGHLEVGNASRNQLKPGNKEQEPASNTSIFYPINYGYNVPDEPEPEVEPSKPQTNEDTSIEKGPDLPYNSLFSDADNKFWRELHHTRRANERSAPTNGNEIGSKPETQTERRRRRASDLPLLVADYSDMKNRALKSDSEHHSQSRERVYHSAKSRYRQPRLLPPIARPMQF